MRWRIPTLPLPCNECSFLQQARFTTRFLWWPKQLGRQWRWLEKATWLQVCRAKAYGGMFRDEKNYLVWRDSRWADEDETERGN